MAFPVACGSWKNVMQGGEMRNTERHTPSMTPKSPPREPWGEWIRFFKAYRDLELSALSKHTVAAQFTAVDLDGWMSGWIDNGGYWIDG